MFIFLMGCTNIHKEKCFKNFGSHIFWNQYFTFKFDNKFKQRTSLSCFMDEIGNKQFFINAVIIDENIKIKDGNSAGIMLSITNFENILNKNEIMDIISIITNKNINEYENIEKNNNRFQKRYFKITDVFDSNNSTCRIMVGSIKDYEAINKPKNEEFLLQNDIYTICYLNDYNQLVYLGMSYRMIPQLEKSLWLQDAINNLSLFYHNISTKDGKKMSDILKIEENEIKKLIN